MINLPKRFFNDHVARALDAPAIVRETSKHYVVSADDPALRELLDDAKHYADPAAFDNKDLPHGLRASAVATINAIRNVVGEELEKPVDISDNNPQTTNGSNEERPQNKGVGTMKLHKMNLKELEQARDEIAAEINKRQKLPTVQAELAELAKKHGFSLDELVPSVVSKRGGPGKKRTSGKLYRHPEDPTKTWTGMGRKPQWAKDWEAAKRPLNDLLVNDGKAA